MQKYTPRRTLTYPTLLPRFGEGPEFTLILSLLGSRINHQWIITRNERFSEILRSFRNLLISQWCKLAIEFWKVLKEGLIKVSVVGLEEAQHRRKLGPKTTHIYCRYFTIHELVFCSSSLKSVFRQLHGVSSIVDVC